MEYAVHFVVALVLAVLSSMGGGGGGLVMTPYLILWGVPPTVAIGSGKVGALGLATGATRQFMKVQMIDMQLVKRLMLIVAITSLVGAQAVFSVSERTLEQVVSAVVLGVSLIMFGFLLTGVGLEPRQTKKHHRTLGYAGYAVNTTVQAAVGAGVGLFNSIIFISAFGLTALQALATKRMANIVGLAVTSLVFILQGAVNWVLAAVLLTAYFSGAQIGTKIAIRKGNRFVMAVQAGLGLAMSAWLLLR